MVRIIRDSAVFLQAEDFGTFRAATKFSLIFSLMASKLNHTIRHQLTVRFPAKPLLPTLLGISQHDAKLPCDNSSPASRTIEKSMKALCFQGFFLLAQQIMAMRYLCSYISDGTLVNFAAKCKDAALDDTLLQYKRNKRHPNV